MCTRNMSQSVPVIITEYHSFGESLNSNNILLTVLEAECADSVSGENVLIFHSCLFLIMLYGGRGKGSLWGLFYKDTKPICGGHHFPDLISS